MSVGLAGLFSTLTEGLKAHWIWLALVLVSCLILHVALKHISLYMKDK